MWHCYLPLFWSQRWVQDRSQDCDETLGRCEEGGCLGMGSPLWDQFSTGWW